MQKNLKTPDAASGYSPMNMHKSDIRNQPAYTLAEAARYLKVAPATLRSWVIGRAYPKATGIAHSAALIHPVVGQPVALSFWNLIEAHVLRSLRTEHGVSMEALRMALRYAEKTLGIERLLLNAELRTEAGKLLLDRYGKLIELSASGQLVLRHAFDEHLNRVEWDAWKFPVRLYPFSSNSLPTSSRSIAIDAQLGFGRPLVARQGISTRAIVERIDAGETAAELAADYDLSEREIEEAVVYERAA